MTKEQYKQRQPAEDFGGTEEDWRVYERPQQATYFDKYHHAKRSIANDPRPNGHRKHQNKQGG